MTSGTLYRVREGLPDEVIGEVVRYDLKVKDTRPECLELSDSFSAHFELDIRPFIAGMRVWAALLAGRKGKAAYWQRRVRRLER